MDDAHQPAGTLPRSLDAYWADCRAEVVPDDLPEEVVDVFRAAFYAGARSVLAILADLGEDSAVGPDRAAFVMNVLALEVRAVLRGMMGDNNDA